MSHHHPSGLRVYAFNGHIPRVSTHAYVHPTAVLVGDVEVGPRCYVGPGAVLRGDNGPIRMMEESNLQDLCVVHGAPGNGTRIERRAHIGHSTTLHGCLIGENGFVGMNCVVMDNAVVGKDAYVGAQSCLPAGFELQEGMLAVGAPAKAIKPVSDSLKAQKVASTQGYVDLVAVCLESSYETTARLLLSETKGTSPAVKKTRFSFRNLLLTRRETVGAGAAPQ